MSVLQSLCSYAMPLEVTEDADISKLFAVAVSAQGEQEGPLEAHEAPHTGQVEAPRVSQGCGRERHRLAFSTPLDQSSVFLILM